VTNPPRPFAALLAAALLASAAPAGAQTAAEIAGAKKAFKEGEEAEKRRDYRLALTKFQQAMSVKETSQLLLRVGAMQEKLGQLVEALEAYERGLAKANAQGLAPVIKVAQEQIDSLKTRVPTVTVNAAKPYPELVITLDDKPIAPAAFGTKIRLNPGQHKLAATAQGYPAQEKPFVANERDTFDFTMDLAPGAAPARAAQSVEASKPAGPSKLPGVLLVGGGGAALATGVVLLVVAFSKDSAIDDLCGGPDRLDCPRSRADDINSRISTVKVFQVLSLGAGVLGAAGVGVGTYLLVRKPPEPSSKTGAIWVDVAPAAGPGEVGLRATGRF
jgi:hypothetical protein